MQLDENGMRDLAAQLRKPEGEMGVQTGERMNKGNKAMNLEAIAQLAVEPNDTILEIGMGNGFFVAQILDVDTSVSYAGVDYSSTMVEEAGKLNGVYVANGQAQFAVALAEDLPFNTNTFTKAFTVNTLYFWEEPKTVLTELHRVLKPGGKLLIAIRPKVEMEKYPFTQYGFTLYSAEDVSELLAANGFVVDRVVEVKEDAVEVNGHTFVPEAVVICAMAVK